MLHFIVSFVGILLTILFIVGTHEAGHFFAARLVGVKVLTFSIGFGKTLLRRVDKRGTEYVFALIPLGGYVRMVDESEGHVDKKDLRHAYNRQPLYKKFIIVLAGPLMNFICAILLYWVIFTVGFTTAKPIIGSIKPDTIAARAGMKPNQQIVSIDQKEINTWANALFQILSHVGSNDQMQVTAMNPDNRQTSSYQLDLANWKMDKLNPDPLQSLGITMYEPPMKLEIGFIKPDSAAAKAGLQIGDRLIAINHKPIDGWLEIVNIVHDHPDQPMLFTIKRNNKTQDIHVTIGSQRNIFLEKSGTLGIAPDIKIPPQMLQHVQYSPLAAIPRAVKETYDFASFNLLLFGKMVTGKLSLESLGGPITIFDSAGDSLNYGFIPFLGFLAFLSASIGVINLFPIPGLDGGHLFLQIIEAVIQRSIPENMIIVLYRMGFLFIIFIMIQAMVNDVLRLF